jgi:hypothetical protein
MNRPTAAALSFVLVVLAQAQFPTANLDISLDPSRLPVDNAILSFINETVPWLRQPPCWTSLTSLTFTLAGEHGATYPLGYRIAESGSMNSSLKRGLASLQSLENVMVYCSASREITVTNTNQLLDCFGHLKLRSLGFHSARFECAGLHFLLMSQLGIEALQLLHVDIGNASWRHALLWIAKQLDLSNVHILDVRNAGSSRSIALFDSKVPEVKVDGIEAVQSSLQELAAKLD